MTFSGRPVRLGRRRFSLGPYRRWKVEVLAALEETFKLREKSVFHRIFRRVGYQLGDARISRHQALHRGHGRQHLLDRALRTASDEWIGLGLERLLDRLRKERSQPRRQRSRSFCRSVPRAHANLTQHARTHPLRPLNAVRCAHGQRGHGQEAEARNRCNDKIRPGADPCPKGGRRPESKRSLAFFLARGRLSVRVWRVKLKDIFLFFLFFLS